MLIFSEERLVLFAVPKTGSTALEGALAPRATIILRNPPDLKHMPVYRYRRFFRPLLEKCGVSDVETVALIREPVDWLASWFRYRSRPDRDGMLQSTAGLEFDDFVKGYLRSKRPPFADVGAQAKFLTDETGHIQVDHLFRYEAIPALITFLNARLGTAILLPRKNVSPERPCHLSPGIETRLRKKYPDDFTVWQAARTD